MEERYHAKKEREYEKSSHDRIECFGNCSEESHQQEEVGRKTRTGYHLHVCLSKSRRKEDSKRQKNETFPSSAKRLDHFLCWSTFRLKPEICSQTRC